MNKTVPSNPLPAPIPRDRLAFDIDGVVADIMTTFLALARERCGQGRNLRYDHITTFYLADCLDLPSAVIEEIIRELIDRPHELPVKPFPQAVPVLTRLAQETPLLFVTARDRVRPIECWLQRMLAAVPPAAIRVLATGDPEAKVHFLQDHGIQYFVEDRLETCLQLADHGITPIVFAQPWNRHPHPFREVQSWPELAG
ncbi:MAG: hypothetical protein P8168_10810, partial [Deltaproteobacteria bacterium]